MTFTLRRISCHDNDINPLPNDPRVYSKQVNKYCHWLIEIKTLEELMELIEKEGEIILDNKGYYLPEYGIESIGMLNYLR